MKILFVTPYLKKKNEVPKGGGLEAYLFRVMGALSRMGHEPVIIALSDEDLHYKEDGIEYHFVKYNGLSFGPRYIRRVYLRLCRTVVVNREIRKLLRQKKVDIIQFPSVDGLAACYFGKVPAVMRLSSYAKIYYSSFLDKRTVNGRSWLERMGARRCNAVFAPSHFIAEAFARDIHRRVSVIETPFWNDVEICDDSIYQRKLSDKKYVLFIGRMDAEKGIVVISKILHAFLLQHPDHYFVCCGRDGLIDGKKSTHILREAAGTCKDRFIYIESVGHDKLYPVIQHAAFVVMPSLAENLSNACMEAMYFERIVIGTDGTSFEQLIDDGKSGALCRPGDAEDLLRKMEQAVSFDAAKRAEIGRNAWARIDRLAPAYTVQRLIRYYQYIIAEHDR